MSKLNELRSNRAKTWEQAKAFLDSHRNEKGILSAEDTTGTPIDELEKRLSLLK